MTKVKIALGAFAAEVLIRDNETGGGREDASGEALRAIRLYLRDRAAGGPTWAYPRFFAERRPSGGDGELELNLDERLWRDFEAEAASQGVAPERLLEHAIFYYAAELDAGRVTARIVAELDEEDGERAGS